MEKNGKLNKIEINFTSGETLTFVHINKEVADEFVTQLRAGKKPYIYLYDEDAGGSCNINVANITYVKIDLEK